MANSPADTSAESTAAGRGPESPGNSDMAPKAHLRIQRTHAAFVSKLYAMVNDTETDALISWTAEGDCFKVTDPAEFSRKVLPLYFKHNNWQSFVRQLNMYGFHKISDLAYGGVFGDTQLWMFKHPFFQRDQVRQLQNIKRRGSKPLQTTQTHPSAETGSELDRASATPSSATARGETAAAAAAQTGLETGDSAGDARSAFSDLASSPACQHAAGYVDELKDCIAELQSSNSQLQRENQEMRAAIMGCQSAFAGIMRFLETAVVQPPESHSASSDRSVVDAFRQLTNDISPLFSLRTSPAHVPIAASPQFFRGQGHRQQPRLPPLRLGSSPESGVESRIPSLSPPALNIGESRPIEQYTRKRCASSSSSSSSSSGSEVEANADLLLGQVVLPPISGVVGEIGYGQQQSEARVHKTKGGWSLPLQSSLRATLAAKRLKAE
ncbi:Flocculation suppression protein [Coemansia sp. RSA 1290]|nr:Flocculation suppression protein [Coemansia sp. RSA 1290]